MYVLHNGRMLPEAGFALPLPNRGLQFNDGFFETMICDQTGIRYLAHHMARMQQAAGVLQLELPTALSSASALLDTLRALVAAQNLYAARLRLQIWRAGGGLYAPETTQVDYVATARPFTPHDSVIVQAEFSQQAYVAFSPLAFCKGPNALRYVQAAAERQQRGLDELILLNDQGFVSECVSAAIFWVRAGRLYTPGLQTGCVAGVRRAHLLQVAQVNRIPCQEGLFMPEDLLTADVAFTANVAALRPIVKVGAAALKTAENSLLAALQVWEAA